jgi:hypothetical protein
MNRFSFRQALIFKLRGVSVEEELGPDESWISPVDVNLVNFLLWPMCTSNKTSRYQISILVGNNSNVIFMLYKNKVIGGCSEKVHTTNFKNKYVIIIKILYYFNLSKVFKIHFCSTKRKILLKN